MALNADDVIGRSLKLKQTVTGFKYYPGSNELIQWENGYTTPPVYSWVTQDGRLFWQFWSEIPGEPSYYLPHESGYYQLLPPVNTEYPSDRPGFYQAVVDKLSPKIPPVIVSGVILGAIYLILKSTK